MFIGWNGLRSTIDTVLLLLLLAACGRFAQQNPGTMTESSTRYPTEIKFEASSTRVSEFSTTSLPPSPTLEPEPVLLYNANKQRLAVNLADGTSRVIGEAAPSGLIRGPDNTRIWIDRLDVLEPTANQKFQVIQDKPDGSDARVLFDDKVFWELGFFDNTMLINEHSVIKEIMLSDDQSQLFFKICSGIMGTGVGCAFHTFDLQSYTVNDLNVRAFDVWMAPDGQRWIRTYRFTSSEGSVLATFLDRTDQEEVEIGNILLGDVRWLSDGRFVYSIVEKANHEPANAQIMLADVDGTPIILIAEAELNMIVGQMVLSPSQQELAYLARNWQAQSQGPELWVTNLDGSDHRMVAHLPEDASDLAWVLLSP